MLVFNKDGEPMEVFPVDARELINTGEYFTYNPVTGEKPEKETVIGKYDKDVEIDKMDRVQLLEYALEKFQVKLNNRWGESRMITEIKKLQDSAKKDAEEEKEDE